MFDMHKSILSFPAHVVIALLATRQSCHRRFSLHRRRRLARGLEGVQVYIHRLSAGFQPPEKTRLGDGFMYPASWLAASITRLSSLVIGGSVVGGAQSGRATFRRQKHQRTRQLPWLSSTADRCHVRLQRELTRGRRYVPQFLSASNSACPASLEVCISRPGLRPEPPRLTLSALLYSATCSALLIPSSPAPRPTMLFLTSPRRQSDAWDWRGMGSLRRKENGPDPRIFSHTLPSP